VLGAILYGAFSLGHRAMEKTEVVFEGNQKFRSAVDLLGSYIRSSYPYRTSPQDSAVFYTGEETQAEFVSAFSLAQGGRGMARIRIYAEGGPGDSQSIKLEEQGPVRIKQEKEAVAINTLCCASESARISRLSRLKTTGELARAVDQDEARIARCAPELS
jgi:hypothetical protein